MVFKNMNKMAPSEIAPLTQPSASVQSLLPLFLICITILTYANSFSAPFIFDDPETISRNTAKFSSITEFLTTRGLTELTFRINIILTGQRPADFRLINIIIHCIAGLFFYLLVRITLNTKKLQKYFTSSTDWIAGVIATLWMLHPIQTESVTYISQRYESLMGLFFLLSLYCFSKGVIATHPRIWFNTSLLSCMAGMMCKEVMVTAPIVILLYDWIFLAPSINEMIRLRRKFYIALFLLYPIFMLLWTAQVAACLQKGVPVTSSLEPWKYLLSQFTILTHYIRIIFLPLNLCLDYAWQPPASVREVILPALFILAIGFASFLYLVRRNPYGFLGSAFFIILAPTSSFIPIEDLTFEHRLYLPLASVIVSVVTVCFIAFTYLGKITPRLKQLYRTCLIILSVVCIISLSYLTIKRNATYSNEEQLWLSVVKLRPNNLRARNNLAAVLCEKKKYSEAMTHLLYVLHQTEGKITYIKERKPLMPLSSEAYRFNALVNIGTMMFHTENYNDAIKYYTEALQIFPYSDIVYAKLCEAQRRHKEKSGSQSP